MPVIRPKQWIFLCIVPQPQPQIFVAGAAFYDARDCDHLSWRSRPLSPAICIEIEERDGGGRRNCIQDGEMDCICRENPL